MCRVCVSLNSVHCSANERIGANLTLSPLTILEIVAIQLHQGVKHIWLASDSKQTFDVSVRLHWADTNSARFRWLENDHYLDRAA